MKPISYLSDNKTSPSYKGLSYEVGLAFKTLVINSKPYISYAIVSYIRKLNDEDRVKLLTARNCSGNTILPFFASDLT